MTAYQTDRYVRGVMCGVPVGGRLPLAGEQCPDDEHEWMIERYPGLRHEYVDKVCIKCPCRDALN